MRRSYTHSEGLKWLSLGHCKSHCLTDFTWWVHFPKCWSIIFILLFLFARLYIVFGFSVLLGDKTFLFYFFWYQLGSEPELSRVWSESTNLYTSWPSHPQAYCQLYLCLLHEQKGFAYFIHRVHHFFFLFFFFTIQISQNRLRAGTAVPHSDHDLRPNEAPCLVWKQSRKPPCQPGVLDPIDLVCTRLWLLFSHESKQTQQREKLVWGSKQLP